MSKNEYQPWIKAEMTELEYWKARYVETGTEVKTLRDENAALKAEIAKLKKEREVATAELRDALRDLVNQHV